MNTPDNPGDNKPKDEPVMFMSLEDIMRQAFARPENTIQARERMLTPEERALYEAISPSDKLH
jgi:hypothetical protein